MPVAGKPKTRSGVTHVIHRAQLHLETVYAQKKRYSVSEVKVSGTLTPDIVTNIANKKIREALADRLVLHDNDAKKAFTGKNAISKNPVVYNQRTGSKVSEKVKTVTLENVYTIRKKVAPGLNIDKVIDAKVKRILVERLREFNNDDKKAFSNLEENPIWFNKEKGIAIKSVKVSGISNAVALHDKRDKYGKLLKDSAGNAIPNSWVNTGNNHHVAIYRDENGNLNEEVVSLFEAVTRKKQGMDLYLKTHPTYGKLILTLKSNEMFLFPSDNFNPFDVDLNDSNNYSKISRNLYRVQKLASKDYFFRHHTETKVSSDKDVKNLTFLRLNSLNSVISIKKVRINNIGILEEVRNYE
jgi:CRISPR-associated endonuclease Csn1